MSRGQPWRRSRGLWRRLLSLKWPERFASVDAGIYGHLPRRNLAKLAEERGDAAEADRLWADVLAECPGDPEAKAARLHLAGRGVREGGPGLENLSRKI